MTSGLPPAFAFVAGEDFLVAMLGGRADKCYGRGMSRSVVPTARRDEAVLPASPRVRGTCNACAPAERNASAERPHRGAVRVDVLCRRARCDARAHAEDVA